MDNELARMADLFGLVREKAEAIGDPEGSNAEESRTLGEAAMNDGRFEDAARHYRRAIEQAGADDDTQDRIALGSALECLEESPAALRQFDRALRHRRDNPEPYVAMGDIYKRHGRVRDAIAQLQEAVRLEPGNGFYHIKIAEHARSVGMTQLALEAANQAVLCEPDESFYHFWVGDLLIALRRYEEALEALQAAVELSPGDDYLLIRAAVAFWGAGKHAEAIKAVRLASDLDPEKDLYYGLLERFLRLTGNDAEADLELRRVRKLDQYDKTSLRKLMQEAGILA